MTPIEDPSALLALSQTAFYAGDLARAQGLLARLVAFPGCGLQAWVNLAVVYQAQGNEAGEEAAIRAALTIDPSDLIALILRAGLLARQGKRHAAARAYGAVAAVAPPLERLAPNLQPAVRQAQAQRDRYQDEFGAFLDAALAPTLDELQGENLARFRESVDIMLGRKRRFDSQSALFHFHGLAPASFFPREAFPWLDAIEAATDAIRAECDVALMDRVALSPYLQYQSDQPLRQWAELNRNLAWSAYHLIEAGVVNADHAACCPATMAALAGAPQPDQRGRTPTAMFSRLQAGTHIPAHTGVSNARLVVHLPLTVPSGCRFRVGNETRAWVPGQAWVFDDTVEHEAWNDGTQARTILMFDIWHPQLSLAERHAVAAMAVAIDAFSKEEGSFGL
ncbi:aspartyl/asparaginyl beta-hydroxylase domain-containing protein [Massilia sp. S19_KUP03_FR1]|uniref:aspartyl/asparaginyl beta-hydroxylase domain-containing protein n=1 Tax=Massilia sp. S19_KUP03_FR1 TaxID=3025503 RepID=UPI002FCDCC25